MPDKKKEKDKSFRVREILIVVIFAVIALVVGGITVINYLRSDDGNNAMDGMTYSSYEECLNALGEHRLPESDSHYVYFASTQKVRRVKDDDMSMVGGYLYDGNKSRISITCSLGDGEIVGYSETLDDDILEVLNLNASASIDLESSGIERAFVNYILYKNYPSSCIISGKKCLYFAFSGQKEVTSYGNYDELFVSDSLCDDVITLIKKFENAEKIKIADSGDYYCSSEGIYDKNAFTLIYLYPWAEKYSAADTLAYFKEGCFKNCSDLEEIEIPYTAQKMYLLFEGESNLKKITFTSAVVDYTIEGLFDGCNSLEEVEFAEGVKTFAKGTFSECTAKNVFLPKSARYVYVEGKNTVFYVYSDTMVYGDYEVLFSGAYAAIKAK